MGNLTLLVGGDKFGGEGQADALPAGASVSHRRFLATYGICHSLLTGIVLRRALVPHTLACVERIADRRVEVLFINQQVVAGGKAVLYPVAVNVGRRLFSHLAIAISALSIDRLCKVFAHDGGRLLSCCGVRASISRIDQQVLRQVNVEEVRQAVVVEQGWVEPATCIGSLVV